MFRQPYIYNARLAILWLIRQHRNIHPVMTQFIGSARPITAAANSSNTDTTLSATGCRSRLT
jgi:hypothetical protein